MLRKPDAFVDLSGSSSRRTIGLIGAAVAEQREKLPRSVDAPSSDPAASCRSEWWSP